MKKKSFIIAVIFICIVIAAACGTFFILDSLFSPQPKDQVSIEKLAKIEKDKKIRSKVSVEEICAKIEKDKKLKKLVAEKLDSEEKRRKELKDLLQLPRQRRQNNNNNSKNIRVNYGNGSYADYRWDDEGNLHYTTVTQCIWCKGTKICEFCHGSKKQFLSGMWYPCRGCNGTGVCTNCQGKGHTVAVGLTDADGNARLVSSDGYTADGTADGAIVTSPTGKVSAHSKGSSHKSSTGSSRTQCPKCNGRKYELTAYTYAPASASGWAQPYHNTGGACPYCNRYDSHYHSPCTECFGHGRVKR